MKKKLLITFAIIAALVGLRYGFTLYGTMMRGKMMGEMMTPKVGISKAQQMEFKNEIETTGRVSAKYSVDLIARVDGYLINKNFKEGDFVKKGQPLFNIEQRQYAIALNKAKADLETAKAQAIKALKDYERSKELVAKDYIAISTYDDSLAQRDVAQANVKVAQAVLNDAQRNFDYTTIKSPIDGRIGMIQVTEGNYVSAQSGALATVVSTNPVYVSYGIDSKLFNDMRDSEILPKKGSKQKVQVEITLPNGEIYEHKGVEDFVDNQINLTTGSIGLRATFENPDHKLIPGDFVRVKVFSNKVNKEIVIPQDAVLQDSKGRYVYVIDEQMKAQKKYVETKQEYKEYWVIQSGLNLGEEYVSNGAVKVIEGNPVKIIKDNEILAEKNEKVAGQ